MSDCEGQITHSVKINMRVVVVALESFVTVIAGLSLLPFRCYLLHFLTFFIGRNHSHSQRYNIRPKLEKKNCYII